ncbi:ABC transporter ATP-binding protein [Photobacterium sp. WH77]|uniref:ABC transporter ATP-binding protein n=1 Tax=Photobacterium arenosum TaxID=2774143 RepID=A0ABR9BFG7_9GAMM|nr:MULTISPECIES: ABC transporter ATP-binding protein [Photobacterium]MBD8511300.1 ABC transporter ATP-binding protein [Photobacterium arenosum]MBV7262955.1 ABC transporter ATP-binding protein [Photobacterium sp. WH24]MCG2838421.1 ABC transporter ATP-binding protein [Photobacterium sp. WH77]MCG2846038.1 ABC transporter ATP-binding protein [Photobacterium sp. WH80]MDO6582093.1 ABC transporter ATP-binding protein [Photobacterium sp. 2_MG-2023]
MNTAKPSPDTQPHCLGVRVKQLTLSFSGQTAPLFSQLDLTLQAGEWHCILGRSGCGKTTLLRLLADLLPQDVAWQGELFTSDARSMSDRVAYMAQQDLLLPWLNVLDNVCFSFRLKQGKASEAVQERAIQLLQQVGLGEKLHARPSQLSGGMRQRVALVRTLIQDKPLVLMDEPFSALDAVTRYKLQDLAAELLAQRTVLLITHDPQEALRLGHHLFLMQGKPGRLTRLSVPEGTPPRAINAELAVKQQAIIEQLSGLGERYV